MQETKIKLDTNHFNDTSFITSLVHLIKLIIKINYCAFNLVVDIFGNCWGMGLPINHYSCNSATIIQVRNHWEVIFLLPSS